MIVLNVEVSGLGLRPKRRSKGSAETVEHIGTAELPKKPTRKVDKSKGRTPHRDSTFSLRVKYNVYLAWSYEFQYNEEEITDEKRNEMLKHRAAMCQLQNELLSELCKLRLGT